jgi:L,D-peptidoglycan transpeptidase YkuD (ErfK/YbiS/YcfS/YnhG family)
MKSSQISPQPCQQLVVIGLSARRQQGMLLCGNLRLPCALGRSGRRPLKREGDGATPIGRFALRQVLYRPHRVPRPHTLLPVSALRPDDGWCDAPGDRNYNRKVRHPYPASAERLWRQDHLYDLIVVMSHNERPRVRGCGSAVFMHVAGPGYQPTEGCIALRREHLQRLLACVAANAVVTICA